MSVRGDAVLVTGAAGFIGYHVARRLLEQGRVVVGLDDLNGYYDPALKRARLAELARFEAFGFVELDVADRAHVATLFASHGFQHVVHLAAQAGVRHSLIDPSVYASANLVGFLNVLEGCRAVACAHLVYASSSSVYGANTTTPFRLSNDTDHPLSLYGATKKANEVMAYAYAHLFDIPTTGLRFFTVYGPWGRPDMAIWLFTEAVLNGKPIRLFNRGLMRRDFTYIDDAVEAVVRVLNHPPKLERSGGGATQGAPQVTAPARLYNVGNHTPVEVSEVVRLIEQALGREAVRELLPMQPGEVPETFADVSDLEASFGYRPATPIAEGIRRFVDWYRGYAEDSKRS